MFFSRYFSGSLICSATSRRRPARCLAAATSGSSKTSISTCVALVDQRREADQRLAALADLHQLGQLAEGPGGVARRLGRRRPARGAGVAASPRRDWRFAAPASAGAGRRRRRQLQRRQRLERRARLAAEFGLQRWPGGGPCRAGGRARRRRGSSSAGAAAAVQLEVVALHRELGALAHRLQQRVDQRALRERACAATELVGIVGQRHQARARPLVQALAAAPAPCPSACRAPAIRSAPR